MLVTGQSDAQDQLVEALEDIADILSKATQSQKDVVVNVPKQEATVVNVPSQPPPSVNIDTPDLRPVLLDIAKHLKDIVSYHKQPQTTMLTVNRDGVGRIETIAITKK